MAKLFAECQGLSDKCAGLDKILVKFLTNLEESSEPMTPEKLEKVGNDADTLETSQKELKKQFGVMAGRLKSKLYKVGG